MIKTISYNDVSNITYPEQRDYNYMIAAFKDLHSKGGNVTLMVKTSNYSGDKAELITFRDFVIKNISEPEKFLQELMKEGVISGLCDFSWDNTTGTIEETKDYGLSWMKNNYINFSEMINQSILSLIKKLPEDISKIKTYNRYDYEGNPKSDNFLHPLVHIANTIHQNDIYSLIISNIPQLKKEWEKLDRDGDPLFVTTIDAKYSDVRDSQLGVLFYMFGIGKEYFHEEEQKTKLQQLIKSAASTGNIAFLKEVLPQINLKDIESNFHTYELSLPHALNKETANVLLDHGAIIKQKVVIKNSTYNVNALDDIKNITVFDTILERTPELVEQIKTSPNDFYKIMCMNNKSIDFTKLLIEKYNFPLENFDMLKVAWINDKTSYSWLLKNGADSRECDSFCNSIVQARDEGLKHLRQLNKEGLIVSKSPDMIFNIFNSSPTKIFINYYDKVTSVELEKLTKTGKPAWWGATQSLDYQFMLSRIDNPTQNANNGQTLLDYLLSRQLKNNKLVSPREIIQLQLKKALKKNPKFKFDLDYRDSNNNTFLHKIISIVEYGKDSIDYELINLLKENSNQDPISYFQKKNNDNITPLELIFTQKFKNYFGQNKVLKLILDNPSSINFNEVLTTGEKTSDKFLEFFKDEPERLALINALILNAGLPHNNVKPSTKRIKL